jgi:hypothetical protein
LPSSPEYRLGEIIILSIPNVHIQARTISRRSLARCNIPHPSPYPIVSSLSAVILVLVLALSLGVVIVLFILTLSVPLNTISCLISIPLITGIIEVTVEHSFPDRLSIPILTVISVAE